MNLKHLILIGATAGSIPACAPAITEAELDRLIPALIQVESRGNDNALGDYRNGKAQAVGCLQIWPDYVKDCNRIAGTHYTLDDRKDRLKSIQMTRIYLRHYAKGKGIEAAARMHNGVCNGDKKAATIKYWSKVKKEMDK